MKKNNRCFELGSYRKLPHYAVIGDPLSFYIWINEYGFGNNSRWITGKNAFSIYHKLKKLHSKDKKSFISEVKSLYINNA